MHDVREQMEKQQEEILEAVRETVRQELAAARRGQDQAVNTQKTGLAAQVAGGPGVAIEQGDQAGGTQLPGAGGGSTQNQGNPPLGRGGAGSGQGPDGQGQWSTKEEGAGPGGGSGLSLAGLNLGVFKAQVQAQLSKEMEANLTKLRQVITETQELAYKLEAVLSGDVGGFGVTPQEAARQRATSQGRRQAQGAGTSPAGVRARP